MQFIPDNLRRVLGDRLKSGYPAKPKIIVEVDRYMYVPGQSDVLEVYDHEVEKTIVTTTADDIPSEITELEFVFPLQGKSWGSKGVDWDITSHHGSVNTSRPDHKGIDIASYGTPSQVVSAWEGTVIRVGFQQNDAGHYVVIQHPGGEQSKYFHLESKPLVEEGQKVSAGTVLGTEGATGSTSGTHLHFELIVNGENVDPQPYLSGEKSLYGSLVNPGSPVTSTTTGYPGDLVLEEKMLTSNWHENNMYTIKSSVGNFFSSEYKSGGGYKGVFRFPYDYRQIGWFNIQTNMKKKGWMDLDVASNFMKGDDDSLEIYVNNQRVAFINEFKGKDTIQSIKDIPIPSGAVEISIVAIAGADNILLEDKELSIHYIKIQEIDEKAEVEAIEAQEYLDNWVGEFENLIFKEKKYEVVVEAGRFEYQDTLTLDNIVVCEVEHSLEQECAEARIVLSNPNGMYSPDYTPFNFPDLMARNMQSPFNFQIPGSDQFIGVLSENTPIRIYMGYGHDDHKPIRVFTGLIDSVDINGGDGTITIQARDMYKKIVNQVLTRRREYPEGANAGLGLATNADIAKMTRLEQIIYWGWYYCKHYGLPENSHLFLLAIAKHETDFGTLGAGKESSGSYVLGYGATDKGKLGQYAGIETQMKYGAKRMLDALGSKGYKINSWEDVKYFWKGGDYGDYQWSTDKGLPENTWVNKVWQYYKEIVANPSKWQPKITVSEPTVDTSAIGDSVPYPGYYLKKGSSGDNVKLVQEKLGITADGIFGQQTHDAVIKYQQENGLVADGIVGQQTWSALFGSVGTDSINYEEKAEKAQWMLSAVIQDVIRDAGMFGWRRNQDDVHYPDAVIEESYYTQVLPMEGMVIKAVPGEEGKFEKVPATSIPTMEGWRNPFCVEYGKTYIELQWKINEIINELIEDTNYRSYCDRYGTYRLEHIDMFKPIVAEFRNDENLVTINRTIDFSRARSNLVIYDGDGKFSSYVDAEIFNELKGEVRTATVVVEWAKTEKEKREVARRLFYDMKRICRTVQISVPGNPALDILDRVRVIDKNSATHAIYTIKGIRHSFSTESGYIMVLDLMWSANDALLPADSIKLNRVEEVYIDESNALPIGTAEPGSGSALANAIIATGMTLLGKPYKWGGGRTEKDILNGEHDCSSFIHWIFKQNGVILYDSDPNNVTTDQLATVGTKVEGGLSNAKVGDLIFFDTYKKDGHVGIFLGNNKFLGAQSSTGVSEQTIIGHPFWESVFKGHIRRVI